MKRIAVIFLILISVQSEASIKTAWLNFCSRHLIGLDPWPYAEDSNDALYSLHRMYKDTNDKAMREVDREIEYRLEHGLLIKEKR